MPHIRLRRSAASSRKHNLSHQSAGSLEGVVFLQAMCFGSLRQRQHSANLRTQLAAGQLLVDRECGLALFFGGCLEHDKPVYAASLVVKLFGRTSTDSVQRS